MTFASLRAALAAVLFFALPFAAVAADVLKNVRKVTVTGDVTVSATVKKTAAQRLKLAVRKTRRPVPLPKVAMEVLLSEVVKGTGAHAGRNSIAVEVRLNEAGGGSERKRFTVNSFMRGDKAADRALAEAVAGRIALAYQLATVRSAPTHWKRPGKGRKTAGVRRNLSAQQRGDVAYQTPRVKDPVIIPTEAALTVRSRARPSTGKAGETPCVVTLERSCN